METITYRKWNINAGSAFLGGAYETTHISGEVTGENDRYIGIVDEHGFHTWINKKDILYYVADLQDLQDYELLTIEGIREKLLYHWNECNCCNTYWETDCRCEEIYNEFKNTRDEKVLFEGLSGIDYIEFETEKEYKEFCQGNGYE